MSALLTESDLAALRRWLRSPDVVLNVVVNGHVDEITPWLPLLVGRIDELASENARLDKMNDEFQAITLKHQTENARLREALEKISKMIVHHDVWETASLALAGGERGG